MRSAKIVCSVRFSKRTHRSAQRMESGIILRYYVSQFFEDYPTPLLGIPLPPRVPLVSHDVHITLSQGTESLGIEESLGVRLIHVSIQLRFKYV